VDDGRYVEHHDGLGSITDISSLAGDSVSWSTYEPFGQLRSAGTVAGAPVDPFAFAGQQLDAPSGLYHLRARQYDPATGRFTATDPVGLPIGDPYVASYVYANQNPVVLTDPSGKCLFICAAIGAVVGGVIGGAVYLATTPPDQRSLGGLAGHAAVGAAAGALVGFTGGVAGGALLSGTLSGGGATIMVATAGYTAGLVQSAGAKLIGDRVTASTIAWNVAGSTLSAGVGGPATGSAYELAFGTRALLSDTISIGTGIAGAVGK
jgi:RHS repeat-associated protein